MTEITHHLWLQSGIGKDLSEAEARELFMNSRRERYTGGDKLFEEGDAPVSFFLIASGEVDVVKRGERGTSTVLATLGTGSVVGEMSLLTGDTRSATAFVKKDATVLRVQWKDFEELLRQN